MNEHWGVRALHASVFSLPQGVLEPPRTSDCTIVIGSGGLGSTGCEVPSPLLVVTELRELVSTGDADLKAHRGARALHACVFSLLQGLLEPPRTSDCTIAVVSGGLRSTGCEAPSPVLVVTELRELFFQLERPA